ncbi:MAG: Glutaredoxin [Thermoanaerobacterium sp.]|jgi:glutaredoxin|nr:Glutaredoxin [Thermoanaerobacterium sp.]
MILVIGTQNCARCKSVKTILDNKNIKYEYKDISDFTKEEQDLFFDMANKEKQKSFPLIIKDNKIITLQEVSNVY